MLAQFVSVLIFSQLSFATSKTVSLQTPFTVEEPATRFFSGLIQPSSLDGKMMYGSAYPSLVKRSVNVKAGQVLECTLQQGRMFMTMIQKSEKPLAYIAKDSDGSFTGTLQFADETLSAWSYDIQVLKPSSGRITGHLPENGAKIEPASGKMSIRKIWNDQVLISEEYGSISENEYKWQLKQAQAKNSAISVPEDCR